jgi:hypothetical protein
MLEKSFAVLVATVCLMLLARLFMPARYRWRLDAWAQRHWRAIQGAVQQAWRTRSSRKEAERIADEAIRRARKGAARSVERDGNVLRPKSFRQPRDSRDSREPRKPH